MKERRLIVGPPTGTGMYLYATSDQADEAVGFAEIKNSRVTLSATQYGESSGLFPMELHKKKFHDASWVDALNP